jgi:hypothetical protein
MTEVFLVFGMDPGNFRTGPVLRQVCTTEQDAVEWLKENEHRASDPPDVFWWMKHERNEPSGVMPDSITVRNFTYYAIDRVAMYTAPVCNCYSVPGDSPNCDVHPRY